MTYYDTSVGLGACGNLNQNSAWTVALNQAQFGNSYPSPECGKTITISVGGKTAQAVIQDSCPGCPYGGLDLSPSLFQHFADLGAGVLSGDWDYGSGYVAPAPEPTTSHTPTSTYVAPTTSWTPEPSTSSTPTPTSTWVAPTTSSAAPSSSSTPSSSAAPSSSVAPSSSSISASASASGSNSASSANASQTESLLSALLGSSTGTISGAAASETASSTSGSESTGTDSDGNLQMLSNVIVNLGRLVVMAA